MTASVTGRSRAATGSSAAAASTKRSRAPAGSVSNTCSSSRSRRDAAGERHEFHFRVRLLGDRVVLEAFELNAGEPGGYEFEVLGDPEGDLFALLAGLIARMRRAL